MRSVISSPEGAGSDRVMAEAERRVARKVSTSRWAGCGTGAPNSGDAGRFRDMIAAPCSAGYQALISGLDEA
jgi:hypothetical protein